MPLAEKIRNQAIGYWVALDAPIATERIARLGYDYVVLDGQHGFLGYAGLVAGLQAITAGGASEGLVRVEACDPTPIGRALDAGAAGVIVPLIDTAADAARAVSAGRYPPAGARSFGPQRVPGTPADHNARVLVIAMIETAQALTNLDEICATPGLDAVYIGPSDLSLALGGAVPGDPAIAATFESTLTRIRVAAHSAGLAAGIHTPTGDLAARRLAEGFDFASIAADLAHLEQAAASHLKTARR